MLSAYDNSPMLVPFTRTIPRTPLSDAAALRILACLHSVSPEGTHLNQPGVEPMRAVRATRNPGFASIESPQAQRAGPGRSSHPTTQFARPRSPNSDLRSPTPCVLVLEIVIVFVFPSVPSASSCSFSSLSSCSRQSTLNSEEENHERHETHERLAKTMIQACRWDVYGFRPVVLPPPVRFRRRRSAPYGHPAPWQRHIPHAFPGLVRRLQAANQAGNQYRSTNRLWRKRTP